MKPMNRRGFLAALGAGLASMALPLDDPEALERVKGRQRVYSFGTSPIWTPGPAQGPVVLGALGIETWIGMYGVTGTMLSAYALCE